MDTSHDVFVNIQQDERRERSSISIPIFFFLCVCAYCFHTTIMYYTNPKGPYMYVDQYRSVSIYPFSNTMPQLNYSETSHSICGFSRHFNHHKVFDSAMTITIYLTLSCYIGLLHSMDINVNNFKPRRLKKQ